MLIVKLIARPAFVKFPIEMGVARADQLQGSDAQKIIELAGRVCYDSLGKGRSSAEYCDHILESGHHSVLEHAQFAFFLSGMSRGLTHELVRHRIGVAISQRSTRYVDESTSPWIVHPLLEQYLDENDSFGPVGEAWNAAIDKCREAYDLIVERLQAYLLGKGVDKLTARKQARGAARGILGNALETEMIWSANVRALRHVITMRAAAAADAEIRVLGCALFKIMREELPPFFRDFRLEPSPDGLGEIVVSAKP